MSRARFVTAAVSLALALAARGDCRVDASGLPFGKYDFLSSSPLDAVGELTVTCDGPANFSVELASSGSRDGAMRTMRGPGGRALRYLLFHDPAYRRPWHDGVSGDLAPGRTGHANEGRVRIFGRVPPRQAVPPGLYQDQVVVTVMW